MSIYYSLISRGSTVLVENTQCSGNFQQITLNILQKLDVDQNALCSYSTDE